MKFFRVIGLRQLLIIITGLTFLNMGFVSAEISLFDLDRYTQIAEDLSASAEDEQEAAESEAGDSFEEEIDLLNHFYHTRLVQVSYVVLHRHNSFVVKKVGSAYREIFSPPPEHISTVA